MISSCCRCCRQNEKQSNDGSYPQSIDMHVSAMRHCSVHGVELDCMGSRCVGVGAKHF